MGKINSLWSVNFDSTLSIEESTAWDLTDVNVTDDMHHEWINKSNNSY